MCHVVFLTGLDPSTNNNRDALPYWMAAMVKSPVLSCWCGVVHVPQKRNTPYKVVPPSQIAKVGEHNSNFTMVYHTQITIVDGVYKPRNISGGQHLTLIPQAVHLPENKPTDKANPR